MHRLFLNTFAVVALSGGCLSAMASDRLIVKFHATNSQARLQTLEAGRTLAASVMAANTRNTEWVRSSDADIHIFRFDPTTTPSDREAQLNRLRSDPRVQFAVPDRRVRSQATANDALFRQQWSLSSQSAGAARFAAAWDQYRGSAATVVAVVDSGLLPNHPDLQGRLLDGYDFISVAAIGNDGDGRDRDATDPGNWVSAAELNRPEFKDCEESNSSWHGTHVAGLIAGNTNDGMGIAGANWNARLLPIRALGKCGGYLSDVMDGARWAAGIAIPGLPVNPNPAAIINMSLGGIGACGQFEQAAIDQINTRNAVVVAAAGNGAGAVDTPANCRGVIAVGAVDVDGRRASYSAMGAAITLMAPGGDTQGMPGPGNTGSTRPQTDNWSGKIGTSFATPMVSAALALMHGMRGSLRWDEAMAALQRSARPFPSTLGSAQCTADFGRGKCTCTTQMCGAGLLDAQTLVSQVRAGSALANASLTASGDGFWVLDSTASIGSANRPVVSHSWEQLTGPQRLTLRDSGVPGRIQLPVPNRAGAYLFRVTVQDSIGNTHQALVGRSALASETGNDPVANPAPTPQTGTGNNGNGQTGNGGSTGNDGNQSNGGSGRDDSNGATGGDVVQSPDDAGAGTGTTPPTAGSPMSAGSGGGGAIQWVHLALLLTGSCMLRICRQPVWATAQRSLETAPCARVLSGH